MFVELHILQNVAPSNLNRDDTGSPKDCEFGGYRRARISSQCLKRAVRTDFKMKLAPELLAKRTKRLVENLVERLEARGKEAEQVRAVARFALGGVGLSVGDDDKTQYLLFLGNQEIGGMADVFAEHWDQLVAEAAGTTSTAEGGTRRAAKSSAKGAVPREVREAMFEVLDGGRAADLALFGRMLADLPDKNINAASQVAHAISTNRISMELDYYTAVDDLKPEDAAGADMIGTVGFNSACFYRYSNVDVGQLEHNLQGDEELTRKTLDAYIRGSVNVVPTGKQNSMAAHNPPSFVFAVVRKSLLSNLANAFLRPVTPSRDVDLASSSIQALDSYWGKLTKMYGDGAVIGKWAVSLEEDCVANLKGDLVPNMEELVGNVLAAATSSQTNGR
jgi:CRISPR system Cascade subunit CasC